jgi:hypothetical protein
MTAICKPKTNNLYFQWTVLQKPVSISLEQLVKFRYIREKNGVDIMGKIHTNYYII